MNQLSFIAVSLLFATLMFAFTNRSAAQGPGGGVPGAHLAVVETSMGNFEIDLYAADAPKTVENFIKLAERKYFDGVRFHRVVRNFVIQTGDPNSKDKKKVELWGQGGESAWGKEFADELNPNTPSYKAGYMKGVVAMANKGPNTNTSQFFIMLRDNTTLPKNYTIFGKVVKGIDVVEKIGQVEIDPQPDGRPKVDVVVKKIHIMHSGGTAPKK
jgi:cyclophilin family peptidyl-prolyl cis-trans isomerase